MDTLHLDLTISELAKALQTNIDVVEAYMRSFDKNDFFAFSGADDRTKYYKKQYLVFFNSFTKNFVCIVRSIGELSSMLIDADASMNEELTKRLGRIIEAYEVYEQSIYSCLGDIENEASSKTGSVSVLLSLAKSIKLSTETFMKTL